MKFIKFTLGSCGLFLFTSHASAVEIETDSWIFSVNGNVNGFYSHIQCDDSNSVVNGNPLLCSGDDASAVTNGYLPAALDIGVAREVSGYHISAHIIYEGGTVSNEAFNNGSSQEAFRAYMNVGNDTIGSVKIGKDFGLFGNDSVFNDMSVFGVGAHAVVISPLNTSLGAAGYGYIFADRLSMINYTLPIPGAFSATVGVFQPLDLLTLGAQNSTTGESGSTAPGYHGKLKYAFDGGFVSTSLLTQKVKNQNVNDNALGWDVAAKITLLENLSVFGSYTSSEGVGNAGLFFDAYDAQGEARESSGYFLQSMYDFGGTRLGVNYGLTDIKRTASDPVDNVNENSKVTLGLYHDLFEGFIVSGEVSRYESESFAGNEIENTGLSLGAVYFF
ncbi:porin family protein [Enterovibrio calviensis]|uniref:hypothetical protein n=1 Tax=Enterovibrio calviensis TaxID=91359 RepID=UPI000551B162|nr:hypothetical protein [Enterovibrio calviensis]